MKRGCRPPPPLNVIISSRQLYKLRTEENRKLSHIGEVSPFTVQGHKLENCHRKFKAVNFPSARSGTFNGAYDFACQCIAIKKFLVETTQIW